jgi:hypothetical protein
MFRERVRNSRDAPKTFLLPGKDLLVSGKKDSFVKTSVN